MIIALIIFLQHLTTVYVIAIFVSIKIFYFKPDYDSEEDDEEENNERLLRKTPILLVIFIS